MAPSIYTAKVTLTYPLYAADFDPYDNKRLVVGGGGGEGRSGIGNKITILESTTTEISTLMELELSRDEDSVTSLAVANSEPDAHSMQIFAGVNSSTESKKVGINEHFRRFRVTHKGRKGKAQWEVDPPLSLFSPTGDDKDVYQRITRLSPIRRVESAHGPSKRLGAIATGFSPVGEILLLSPARPDFVRGRISLGKLEAADIDIIRTGSQEFEVVYCTDRGVNLCATSTQLTAKKRDKPIVPRPLYERLSVVPGKGRPTFRALRFLTPSLILLLSNLPGRSGAELLVLRADDQDMGQIVLQKRLHSSMKAGACLDVAILEEGGKGETDGDKQFVIAVAGQDISLEILTLDHSVKAGLGRFRTFSIIRNVHPHQMTKICFSQLVPPTDPPPSKPSDAGPKTLKLASVSMGNTVVVHTLPLWPIRRKSKPPRYVLTRPGRSRTAQTIISILLLVVVACAAPPGSPEPAMEPYIVDADRDGSAQQVIQHLKSLLHRDDGEASPKMIVVREGETTEVRADVHTDEEDVKGAKRWEELEEHQREGWRRKLAEAGQWAAGEGEAILKGVFFAELGGAIGDAVGG
ncbi:MAG: Glycine--tRNA ligase 1, mitochondrial [Geoglossum umbratile]|nr:MAG: Glycine--tRNA ligase 1, mitochondrial [Geoglossum umbratile]